MKKLMITSLLTAAVMLAQTAGTAPAQSGTTDQGSTTGKTKHTRTRRHHKKTKSTTTDTTTTTTPAPATK